MSAWEERMLKTMNQIAYMEDQFGQLTDAHCEALKDIVILANSISSLIEIVRNIDGGEQVLANYDWEEIKAVVSRYQNQ